MILDSLTEVIYGLKFGHPTRVGINGRSGAGKTTFVDDLAIALEERGREVIRASVDDFARPAAERYSLGRLSPEGYYRDAVDLPVLRARLLDGLGSNGDSRYVTASFDTAADRSVDMKPQFARPEAILIVDGVFLFRPELADAWDYRIFLQVDPEVSYRRAMARDASQPVWSPLAERFEKRYKPAEQLYIDTMVPETIAHVVINNTDPSKREFWFRPTSP